MRFSIIFKENYIAWLWLISHIISRHKLFPKSRNWLNWPTSLSFITSTFMSIKFFIQSQRYKWSIPRLTIHYEFLIVGNITIITSFRTFNNTQLRLTNFNIRLWYFFTLWEYFCFTTILSRRISSNRSWIFPVCTPAKVPFEEYVLVMLDNPLLNHQYRISSRRCNIVRIINIIMNITMLLSKLIRIIS